MKQVKFNDGWKFWLDKNAFALVWNIPEHAQEVTLPHDAMLESRPYAESLNGGNTGYRDGEVYNYVKILHPEAEDAGKTLMLKFEGIYMNALVYVNGQLAGKCPYGYTGFYVPLNDYLKFGQDNELRVIVRNSAMTNSRWYSGGGIYRDVYMLTAEPVYIQPEGVRVKTEWAADGEASLNIKTMLKNRSCLRRELTLETVITDPDGHVAAQNTCPVVLYEGEERTFDFRLLVTDARLWSEDTPSMYHVTTRLMDGEHVVDVSADTFGIRTLTVDPVHGFRVNGKTVKFRGACIHHDSGLLGAATFEEAEYRRISILKKAGFNAIRMSHHPAAPALLRACDALGMYVMDETFDMWQRCKSDSDYGLYFDEWWEKDVEAMVARGYNHPSVVMYSVGNEIPEIGTDKGAKICQDICAKIKSMDDTRMTLASINGVFAAGDAIPEILSDLEKELKATGEIDANANVNDFMTVMDTQMDKIVVHDAITKRLDKACACTDIAGYNYMTARYAKDQKGRPNRVIVGSETYPPEIARNWACVKTMSHVVGDFTWTGWDYIGEAGVGIPAYSFGEGGFGAKFPCQLAYSGDIDITGFRRPASYFREIVFGLRKAPYIAVQNPERYGQPLIKTPWVISDSIASWTYPGMEGKPVIVEIYAPGDQVELIVNGKSLGLKEAGEKAGYMAHFETVYEPGTLEAISYINGQAAERSTLSTAAGNITLKAAAEESKGELVYINIENSDDEGNVDTSTVLHLNACVEGAMEVRMGSGNPKPLNMYTEPEADSWNGRALLVIRKNDPADTVKVSVQGGGQQINMEV